MKVGLGEHFSYKKLFRFVLPSIVMMIFTSIYGIVDGIFVSNIVGSNAFASVNFVMPVLMIIGAIGFMVGTGGSALVSLTIGQGHQKKANEYFSLLVYFLLAIGIVVSLLVFIFVDKMVRWLGADATIVNNCSLYGRILSVLMPFFLLQSCFQNFLVVAEKPGFGLIITVVAGVTNMILDFLFMYVFRMGVAGAALATGISWIVGTTIPFLYFLKRKEDKLKLVKPKWNKSAVVKSCGNGLSEMLSNISLSIVNMLFNMQLMKYAGANGVVAYGIIMYVSFIFVGTYLGYSFAIAPVIGYNYGAKNNKELKNIFKKSIIVIGIFSVVMTIVAESLSPLLANIFVSYDKELVAMTVLAIRIFSLSFIISGFNIFASSLFTALNNGMISALISFLRTFVFQIIMIFGLPLLFDLNGLWMSVVFAEILSIIVSICCVLCNRKRYQYF